MCALRLRMLQDFPRRAAPLLCIRIVPSPLKRQGGPIQKERQAYVEALSERCEARELMRVQANALFFTSFNEPYLPSSSFC